MREPTIPWWISISGTPLNLVYQAFRSHRFGPLIFLALALGSAYWCYQLRSTPTVWLLALATFISLSSLVQIGLRRRGTRVSNARIHRKPRSLFLSRLLSMHKTWSLLGEPIALLPFILAVAPLLPDNSTTTIGQVVGAWPILVLALFYMPFNRFYVVNIAFLQLAKVLLTKDFRIVVFRKFLDSMPTQSFAHFDSQHKSQVLPALGAYGSLIVIHNDSIDSAAPGPNSDSEEVLAQLREALRCDQNGWHPVVLAELKCADLAVFHWATPPTVNMLWEFQNAREALGTHRLLFVESTPPWGLAQFIDSQFRGAPKPCAISIDTSPIIYANSFHKFMRQLYERNG